ncbi:MAG: MFS transporter [Rhodospirillales bacterium]|nr:MFS transporter [Rhodospirillales bacterium]
MRASSKIFSYFGGFSLALSVRDYRIYWMGQAVSVQGVGIWRISSGVLIYQLTQSPAWLGIISVIYFVPLILLGPVAGAIADRLGYRRTAIATLLVAVFISLLMAALTYLGVMTPYLLAGLIAVLGAGHAFDFPARQVLIQLLVGRDRMSAAIALNTTTFNTASFTGPAIGAALIAWGNTEFGEFGGPALGFVAYAAVSAWFILSLIRIRARDGAPSKTTFGALMIDVKEGMIYTWHHQTICSLIVLWIIASLLIRAYTDLLPGFAVDVFQRGEKGLGTLLSASGLGALILAIGMTIRGRSEGLARMFVISIVVSAVAVLLFVATKNFWFAVAMMVFAGGFAVTAAISAQTLVQATVDPAYRGRVLAIYLSLVPSAQAVGSFVVGWIAEFTSLRLAVGGGAFLALILIALWGPRIWARAGAIDAEALAPPPARVTP